MAWRIILRIGLTDDAGSVVRNHGLKPSFDAMGLHNTETGTWEAEHVTEVAAVNALKDVLQILADPTQVEGSSPEVKLKHFWLYLDHQPDAAGLDEG